MKKLPNTYRAAHLPAAAHQKGALLHTLHFSYTATLLQALCGLRHLP